MEKYQYKAFISYRHQSPDQEIAKKLHTQIETFRIPAAIRKSPEESRMGRVFRDQEELTLTKDLGAGIREALDNSEWLICICSPRYLQSRWCLAELDYFIQQGKRDHILAILADGEPDEAFPPQLCYEIVDGQKVALEPLAADVRGSTVQEALKKLQQEKLRILAPMLDVNFDDLRQRARQRRNRLYAAAAAGVITVLSGFLGYAMVKNAQITSQRNSALTSESKWLAQSAQEALDSGDKMLSMLLSLEALPENFENPERPLVKEALAPLRSAVISGLGDNIYHAATQIEVPGLESWQATGNELRCFSRQSDGYITAYDMVTGKEVEAPYTLSEEPAVFLFSTGGQGYSIFEDRVTWTSRTYTKELSEDVEKASFLDGGGDYMLAETEYRAWGLLQKEAGIFSGFQTYIAYYRDYPEEGGFLLQDVKPLASKDELLIAGYKPSGEEEDGLAVIRVKPGTYSADDILQRYYLDEEMVSQQPKIRSFDVSLSGTIIAVRSYDYICFWNVKDSQMAYAYPCKTWDIAFSSGDNYMLAMRTTDGEIQLFDCREEKVVRTIKNGLYSVMDFMWNSDGTRLLLRCSDNRARIVSVSDGEVLQTLSCDFVLKETRYANETIHGDSANDNYIVLIGDGVIQTYVLGDGSEAEQQSAASKLPDYTAVLSSEQTAGTHLDRINVSKEGKTIWNYRDDGLYVIDAETLETIKIFEDETEYGALAIAKGNVVSVHGDVRVYDAETLEIKAELKPVYPHSYAYSAESEPEDLGEESVGRHAEVSENGAFLKVSYTIPNYFGHQQSPSVFLYSMENFEELWHVGLTAGANQDVPFECAEDWEGVLSLRSEFLHGGSKALLLYVYDTKTSGDYYWNDYAKVANLHIAFEVRDSVSGEVESMYWLPCAIAGFHLDKERGILLLQDVDGNVYVLNAETGEELVTLENPGSIYDCIFEDGVVWLCYVYTGSGTFAPEGSEIRYREGVVHAFDAAERFPQKRIDGKFGDIEIRAEDDGLYDAEDGTKILSWSEEEYVFLRSWDDGSKLLCFAPYNDGSALLTGKNGGIAIIRALPPAELRETALRILDGRVLTEEQKKRYFLE